MRASPVMLLCVVILLSSLCLPVLADRTMTNETIDLMDTSTYDDVFAAIGGNQSLNSSTEGVDIMALLQSAQNPYIAVFGNIFFVIVFGIMFMMLFIRQQSVAIPSVLGIILGGFMLGYLPAEYHLVAISFIAISVTGVIFTIMQER